MQVPKVISILALVLAVVAGASPAVVSASISTLDEGPAAAAQAAPSLTARSAIAVDLTTGLQLYNQDGDIPVLPASTVKMVTVLAARGILLPQELITIADVDVYLGEDYSQMGLLAGDVATVESLFYGALLPSGADASLALARVAGQRLDPETSDPVGRFVEEMNRYAASIGMQGTHFSNPVGFDAEDNYTTARDLVHAAERLLADPLLSQVMATPEILVNVAGPNARELYLVTTNEMVLQGDSIGGKTGTEDLAGECLVNLTRRGQHVIVTVVMGSEARFVDTTTLLESVTHRYQFVRLGAGSTTLGVVDELAQLGLTFPVGSTVMMTPEQANSLQYELQLSDDSTQGRRAGVVVYSTGGREILALPVYAVN